MTVFAIEEDAFYDEIATAVQRSGEVTLRTADGSEYAVPAELVAVIGQAAQYLARDKAVEVTPHSRYRFI